jgi:voltage-gated potassium channel
MYRFNTQHPVRKWLLLLIFVLLFGVIGYVIIEGYSFFDALYMAVITIATIGYD